MRNLQRHPSLDPTNGRINTTVRVTRVRSRGPAGGAIFGGKTERGENFVIVADYSLLPDSRMVDKAQVWEVAGTRTAVSYQVDGITRWEVQITAEELSMQRPSGANLINWITESTECRGIGRTKAKRLYDRFGPGLVALIEAADIGAIATVVGDSEAERLCEAFEKHGLAKTLIWLDQLGIPRKIGASVARYWGTNAQEKVESDPYVLVSFTAKWRFVDQLATHKFGVALNDKRRLAAAVEQVLYSAMDRGHTCVEASKVRSELTKILRDGETVLHAIALSLAEGRVVEDRGMIQTAGLAKMETYVANRLLAMRQGSADEGQAALFAARTPDAVSIQASLDLYESRHGFPLAVEQRDAVLISASNPFSLILGGAGTGKTTVLEVLCQALEKVQPGLAIYQLALAGRAAKRMTESTGRDSKTIAAMLLQEDIPAGSLVLVDEASMVDIILMYRVLRHLSQGVRFVLIGDPAQLPPIGPGLVLHALQGLANIPQVMLKVVQRQTSESGIPKVAEVVREHGLPTWTAYEGKGSGVSFIECSDRQIDEITEVVYIELGGAGQDNSVQVLGVTKNKAGGVKGINTRLHKRFQARAKDVLIPHPEFGRLPERTKEGLNLRVGDLVMYGENDRSNGLKNGSLGRIVEALTLDSLESAVCTAEFDGVAYELNASQVQCLTHSYAITAHKSQGSQFSRVIIPLRDSKLLDNAMIYTAITRAVEQVVIVGNRRAVEAAVKSPSIASLRGSRLASLLEARSS